MYNLEYMFSWEKFGLDKFLSIYDTYFSHNKEGTKTIAKRCIQGKYNQTMPWSK